VHGDLVYVLNSGSAGSVTGFRILPEGLLVGLPGSDRSLGLATRIRTESIRTGG
jgi:hypothetical protein